MDIKIQNLKKIYNGNTVLDIDNLGVAKGELIGLMVRARPPCSV